MRGLILSKSAEKYAELLLSTPVAAQFSHTCDPASISHEEKIQIEWALAEPALILNLLPELPKLRWLQSTWAGIESLVAVNHRRDYTLTNIRGIFAPLMSEYVLAHCLAYERQIVAHHEAKIAQRWLNENNGLIRNKTMLIMGIGSIGLGIAQAARFFGLTTLGIVNTPRQMAELDEVGDLSDLPRLLARADYVVNVLPNTHYTQNIVNAEFLTCMKPTAIFINVGRGQAVVDKDLSEALHRGTIAGAVLDVYREEPLPSEHIFWQTPNLTLTSHTAAPSFPHEVFDIFIENYHRFLRGEALIYQVDFKRGY